MDEKKKSKPKAGSLKKKKKSMKLINFLPAKIKAEKIQNYQHQEGKKDHHC